MLALKTNPSGVDWSIQQLQTKLHNELISAWELADATKYEAYGRVYRNTSENGYVAEVFVSGTEYKEVFWNDVLTAISFFGLGNSIKKGTKSEADVHFVMFADLKKLALKDYKGNAIAHRGDEELRQLVCGIIGRYSYGFTVTSVELSFENVLREYPGTRRDQRLKNVDMHPVHCFRINMKLLYDPNKIC